MLSKAITRSLRSDSTFASLCEGASRISAEIGQGEPAVIIKQNYNTPIIEGSGLRSVGIQLLVSGYKIDKGENISEKGISVVMGLLGVTMTDDVRQFTIKSVSHLNGPTFIGWNDSNVFSSNFIVNFQQVEI